MQSDNNRNNLIYLQAVIIKFKYKVYVIINVLYNVTLSFGYWLKPNCEIVS